MMCRCSLEAIMNVVAIFLSVICSLMEHGLNWIEDSD